MVENTPQQNQSPDFNSTKDLKPLSKIRTMESDIQSVFKEGKESLISAVAKEEAAKKYPALQKPKLSPLKIGLLLFVLGMLTVLAGTVGIYFGFFYEQTPKIETPIEQTVIPRPFFSMEKSRNIILKSFSFLNFPQDLKLIENDKERDGIVKRIVLLIKDETDRERLAGATDFFLAASLTPSKTLLENAGRDFNFFLYYQNGGKVRRGLMLPIINEKRAFRAMLDSETTLRNSFGSLFDPADPRGTLAAFEDITYRNIDIRRNQLSEKDDLGLYYAIFKPKKYLIITTSYESMRTALDRTFDSF